MTPDQYAVLARHDAQVAFACGEVTKADLDALLNDIEGDCYFENRRDEMEMEDE